MGLCSLVFGLHRASIKGPIMSPQSTFDYLTVLSMPQVSVEFLYIASLSRRRHGFDSRTGRQQLESPLEISRK